ncbi:MAG: 2-succinyl-5-enolpyruvyl-6-hydroxy-3-cyclohexene-1-carboxylic-acid synthase, partial [Acidobacteriota bacterium]|nr:2-succinyl-5-enolpyruvyl-6-hydroxy-3-cyclohexene-1-carboxylic-acid synthase [Acidobacteriota bacterium]
MSTASRTAALLRAFADELARCGMRGACTSPGSRNAPLVLALAGEPRIRAFSHLDERCAGFFALGLAKQSGLPVAVTCTSGTALANLAPAVIEASEARVPLLVLSADRPAELRDCGAGQTIDQLKLFGGAVRWFFEVENGDGGPGGEGGSDGEGGHARETADAAGTGALRFMRTLACRAYWRTLEGRPGPVHLNFPLREPLVADDEPPPDTSGRPHGRPYVSRPAGRLRAPGAQARLAELVSRSSRGLVVAGRHEGAGDAAAARAIAAFCESRAWPLLADPLSGARRGGGAIAHYDALLRHPGTRGDLRPDLVLRVGDLPTSKPLRQWLAEDLGSAVTQVALDPQGAWQDPAAVLSDSLALDPAEALGAIPPPTGRPARPGEGEQAPPDWLESWRSADERAAEAILGALGDEMSEPRVAAELGVLLPSEATLFVASSMPVRDIESFWPVRQDPPRALCNRGANGIDGTVSAALGAAAGHAIDGLRSPVVLLVGDVAL